MHALLVAVLALSLASPPLLFGDSLQVVTTDAALGEEIARAARRYLRGTVQVRGATDATNAPGPPQPEATLTVRREPAGGGQRWLLVLSAGEARTIRRTLELHEVPTRFDLAEAVAIGLPDMLARLAEQAPPHPLASLNPTPSAPRQVLATRVAPASPSLPPEPTQPPPRRTEISADKIEPAPPAETTPPPAAPPPATPSPTPPRPATLVPSPLRVVHIEPLLVPAPKLIETAPQEATTTRVPSAAIGLTAGGAIVLLVGIGTGAAAQLAARQVDNPVQGHFDQDLDRRGKALNTAAIVLDSVGGAALAGGSAWILTRVIKARREAAKLTLVPTGAGAVLKGSF